MTYKELVIRDSAVTIFVSEAKHLQDFVVGDMLREMRHHLPEV